MQVSISAPCIEGRQTWTDTVLAGEATGDLRPRMPEGYLRRLLCATALALLGWWKRSAMTMVVVDVRVVGVAVLELGVLVRMGMRLAAVPREVVRVLVVLVVAMGVLMALRRM